MWPKLLDMSRDESKRVLRRIELEAYASIVSAFRAQGDLNKDKRRLLQDLQHFLSISTERHRAEVRRAVNDEKLSTIAEQISGSSNTSSEWVVEGRRLIPLMPRLVPQTAFTATANQAANMQAEKNANLPPPSATGNRDVNVTPLPPPPPAPLPKVSRPSSPTSNVVVLPSGASIHIKGMLEEEEELQSRKRRSRSLSTESQSSSVGTQTAQGPSYRPPPSGPAPLPSISPVKITISKSPQGRALVSQSGSQPPKVILVTSSGHSVTPSVLQRSVSVPIVRATTSTSTGGTPRPSIVVPSTNPPSLAQSMSAFSSVPPNSCSIAASSPQPASIVTTPTTYVGTPSNPIVNPTMLKPRTKLIPRQRFTQPQPKPGVVIPSTPQPVAPSPQTLGVGGAGGFGGKGKPTIQVKQELGMRIITQNLPAGMSKNLPAGTSKILPKPTHLPGTSTPVVVVNAGPSGNPSGGKVLNITPGGRVITSSKASNVVTVNPKTLHLTAVKTPAGTTVSKPNVIVVQKTQPRRSQTPTTAAIGTKSAALFTSPANLERDLAHFLQGKDVGRQMSVTVATVPTTSSSAVVARSQERKVIITTASAGETFRQGGFPILQRSKSDEGGTGGNEWLPYDLEENQPAVAAGGPGETFAMTSVSMDVQQQLTSIPSQPLQPQPEVIEVGPQTFYTVDPMSLLGSADKAVGMESPMVTITSQPSVSISKSLLQGESLLSGAIKPMALPLGAESVVTLTEEAGMEGLASGTLDAQGGQLDPQTGIFYSVATATATTSLSSPSLLHTHGSIITTAPITVTRIPSTIGGEGQAGGGRPTSHTVTVGSGTGAVRAVAHPLASASLPPTSVAPGGEGESQPELEEGGSNLPRGSGQGVDLLSSSLAEAGVNLDGYEMVEEGLPIFPQQSQASLPPSAALPPSSAPQPADSKLAADDGAMDLAEILVPAEEVAQACVETSGTGAPAEKVMEEQVSASAVEEQEQLAAAAVSYSRDSGLPDLGLGGMPSFADSPSTATSSTTCPAENPASAPSSSTTTTTATTTSTTLVADPVPSSSPSISTNLAPIVTSSADSTSASAESVIVSSADSILDMATESVITVASDSAIPVATENVIVAEAENVVVTTSDDVTRTVDDVATTDSVTTTADNVIGASADRILDTVEHILTTCDEDNVVVTSVDSSTAVTSAGFSIATSLSQPSTSTTISTTYSFSTSAPLDVTSNVSVSDFTATAATSVDSSFPAMTHVVPVSVPDALSEEAVFVDMSALDTCYTEISETDVTSTNESSSSSNLPTVVMSTCSDSMSSLPISSAVESPAGSACGMTVLGAGGFSIPNSSSLMAAEPLLASTGAGTFSGTSLVSSLGSVVSTTPAPALALAPAPVPAPRPKPTAFIPLESVTRSQAPINVITRMQHPVVPPSPSSSQSSASASRDAGVVEVLAQGFEGGRSGDNETPGLSGLQEPGTMVVTVDTSEQVVGEELLPVGMELGAGGGGGVGGESPADQDLAGQRGTKRKRRAPSGLEETQSPQGGWVRTALGILQRVSRFRGTNRDKNDINAADWFLHPVNVKEVPDYYTIIKNPMDFGTIKKRLETNHYQNIEEFHADMLLVRDNCELYNPAHCLVRRDCTDVFTFYQGEWDRLVQRWQRTHTGSPGASKKPRQDRSPCKP